MLFLRTVSAKRTSYDGFRWPSEIGSVVTCPDWDPAPCCGGGLHGLPWGQGDLNLLSSDDDAIWQIVEANAAEAVDIDGLKSKFPRCTLVYEGDRAGAIRFMQERAPEGIVLPWAQATAGDEGTAAAGYGGTATAGLRGTATAGDKGIATAGDEGTATAGLRGTATAGLRGTATVGHAGTATAGDEGTATAGLRGTATAGDKGIATAGDEGTATAGLRGTATAGDKGIVSGSENSALVVKYWDRAAGRYRLAIAYVGEEGIKPGTRYQLDADHRFVAVEGGR